MHCKALDGLRGYAALSVVIFHSIIHYNYSKWAYFAMSPIDSFFNHDSTIFSVMISIFNGSTPVLIFFILSGYVLSASVKRNQIGFLNFIIKRVGRIYPSVFACVILTTIVIFAIRHFGSDYPAPSLLDVTYNSLLVDNKVLGVTWTLTIEMAFAFIVYPLVVLRKRYGGVVLVSIMIYSIIAINKPALTLYIPYMNVSMLAFCAGMFLDSEMAKHSFKRSGKYILLAMICTATIGRIYNEWSELFILTHVILCTSIIGSLLHSESNIKKLLESRLSIYLGKISYSLYLFSVPVGYIFYFLFDSYFLTPEFYGFFVGVAISVASVILSSITYKYIEKPCTDATARISKFIFQSSNRLKQSD
ncbi:TPA: acyltransferase [Escherichia coli]|nr:acyltransferase [Escherichia coli]